MEGRFISEGGRLISDIFEVSDNLKIKGFSMTLDTEKELMKTFGIFSTFSGLKPNKNKCEIAGLGALKGAKLALCGMEYIDLMFNAIKTLGVYYSYDKTL